MPKPRFFRKVYVEDILVWFCPKCSAENHVYSSCDGETVFCHQCKREYVTTFDQEETEDAESEEKSGEET